MSKSPIDQLLKSARALGAERLILEAGKSALVQTSSGVKELTKSQLNPYDIFKLISPVVPEEKKVALVSNPSTEFGYSLEGVGEFSVVLVKEASSIKAIFQHRSGTGSLKLAEGASFPTGSTGNLPPVTGNLSPSVSSPSSKSAPLPKASPLMAKPLSTDVAPPMAQPVVPLGQTGALKNTPGQSPQAGQASASIAQPAQSPAAPRPTVAIPQTPPLYGAEESVISAPVVPQPVQPIKPVQPPIVAPPPVVQSPVVHPLGPLQSSPLTPLPVQFEFGQAPPTASKFTPTPAMKAVAPPTPIQQDSHIPALTPAASFPVVTPSPLLSNSGPSLQMQPATVVDKEKAKVEVEKLLELTVKMKGSDLHLATGSPPTVRRLGTLLKLEGEDLDIEKVKLISREILTGEQLNRFERTNDLDFSYELVGIGRFRGNILRQHKGIDITFHVVPAEVQSPEELGLPSIVREVIKHHQGLVLVTGAAGQGKSTTITSLVDVINTTMPLHILTVEDPIEFVHPIKKAIINQREVGRHTLSFANALRAALREDPDVIVVGEMRDAETIALAITAAETGHLVMGTMMTSSAPQTIERILESFPTNQQNQIRTMLSDSLRAIISQRLLAAADESKMVLAAEILIGTPAVGNLIRDKKPFQLPNIMQTNRHLGMKRMDDALLELVQMGRITRQKGLAFAQDRKSFELALKEV